MSSQRRQTLAHRVRSAVLLVAVVGGIVACEGRDVTPPSLIGTATAADEGRQLFLDYGCAACHRLSGVREANARVGPSLDDLDEQRIIAGVLPNTPEHLAAWIVSPRDYAPNTGMPDVGVTPEHARAIADFLLGEAS